MERATISLRTNVLIDTSGCHGSSRHRRRTSFDLEAKENSLLSVCLFVCYVRFKLRATNAHTFTIRQSQPEHVDGNVLFFFCVFGGLFGLLLESFRGVAAL